MFKIIKSMFMIMAVAIIGVSATGASFSDTAEVVGNTFSAGTLELKVNGKDRYRGYAINNLKPGSKDALTGHPFSLKNNGSIKGHAWLEIVNVNNNGGQLGDLVYLSFQKKAGHIWPWYRSTTSINDSQNVRVDLFDLNPGETVPLSINANWPDGDPDIDNAAQGDTVIFDVIFHLDQV